MKKLLFSLLSLVLLAACARETSSDVYDSETFGEATTTHRGTILDMREVTVKNGEGIQNNTTGLIGGGIVGALLGSTIGRGDGRLVATALGGVAGATGGAALQQGLGKEHAMQYIVQLDNGEEKTIVQAIKPYLHVGQKVFVMIPHHGRARIVAR